MRREYVPACFLSCCYTFYLAMLHHIFTFPLNTEVRWHSSTLHQRKWKITMYRTMLYINVAINLSYHGWFLTQYLLTFTLYLFIKFLAILHILNASIYYNSSKTVLKLMKLNFVRRIIRLRNSNRPISLLYANKSTNTRKKLAQNCSTKV